MRSIIALVSILLIIAIITALVVGLKMSAVESAHVETGTAVFPIEVNKKRLVFASDLCPPYAGKADSEREGYIVDILRKIYVAHGYEVQLVNQPWSRCVEDVRRGRLHGLAGADRLETPGFVFPEQPVGTTEPAFFTLAGSSWVFKNMSSLYGQRLGVIQDHTYEEHVNDYIQKYADSGDAVFTVTGNDPLRRLIGALHLNRVDVFIEDRVVVYRMIEELGLDLTEIREAGQPGDGTGIYISLSPQKPESRELAAIFDQGLKSLRENGELKKILDAYQVQDWIHD